MATRGILLLSIAQCSVCWQRGTEVLAARSFKDSSGGSVAHGAKGVVQAVDERGDLFIDWGERAGWLEADAGYGFENIQRAKPTWYIKERKICKLSHMKELLYVNNVKECQEACGATKVLMFTRDPLKHNNKHMCNCCNKAEGEDIMDMIRDNQYYDLYFSHELQQQIEELQFSEGLQEPKKAIVKKKCSAWTADEIKCKPGTAFSPRNGGDTEYTAQQATANCCRQVPHVELQSGEILPFQREGRNLRCRFGDDDLFTVYVDVLKFEVGRQIIRAGHFPKEVKVVNKYSFPRSIERVTFEDGSMLSDIGPATFAESSLRYIRIPASVTHIKTSAFKNSKLKEVVFEGRLPDIQRNAFSGLGYAWPGLKAVFLQDSPENARNKYSDVTNLSNAMFIDKSGATQPGVRDRRKR